jgi:phytoene desaturase
LALMKKFLNGRAVRVVGAGIGGLSAAIHLARSGCRVQVFEKQPCVGGKATEHRAQTPCGRFRWDVGPSLLTMPHILQETLAAAGMDIEKHCPLQHVSPACRYFWPDGRVLDEDEAFWARSDVQNYLRHAKGIYDLSADVFLRRRPEQLWQAVFQGAVLRNALHFPKVATLESLHGLNSRFFQDNQLVQLFDRFATYNGSSPYRTPATFAIIPYIEHAFGAWIPQGGMSRVPAVLEQAARSLGVEFFFNTEVRNLVGDEQVVTVCNADVLSAEGWLPDDSPRAERLRRRPLSCSGFVMLLAVRGHRPKLSHHNVFFSGDYRREFAQIFDEKVPPQEPTVYVSISSRHVPNDAPEGCENWFMLVNVPADPDADFSGYGDVVLNQLARYGVQISKSEILYRHEFGPREIAVRDNAWRGSLYGWASHSPLTALLRPPIRHPRHKNLFFCGGTTHPGGGIPLVLLSGRMAAEAVIENF